MPRALTWPTVASSSRSRKLDSDISLSASHLKHQRPCVARLFRGPGGAHARGCDGSLYVALLGSPAVDNEDVSVLLIPAFECFGFAQRFDFGGGFDKDGRTAAIIAVKEGRN